MPLVRAYDLRLLCAAALDARAPFTVTLSGDRRLPGHAERRQE